MLKASAVRPAFVSLGMFAASAILVGCGAKERPAQTPANTAQLTSAPAREAEEPRTVATVNVAPEVRKLCSLPAPTSAPRFDFASKELGADLGGVLDPVASCLKSGDLAGKKVRLVGRADARGSSEYNMALGQARADAVALFLQQKGVPASTLRTTSRGELDAKGTDETGWAMDRRVDIELAD